MRFMIPVSEYLLPSDSYRKMEMRQAGVFTVLIIAALTQIGKSSASSLSLTKYVVLVLSGLN